MQLVWFKKDLRIQDHEPLYKARAKGPTMAVYIVEPQWLASFETTGFQEQFLWDSLVELRADLQSVGIPLLILQGNALDLSLIHI